MFGRWFLGKLGTWYGGHFAPKRVGLQFSVESEYGGVTPWGVHKPWEWIHGAEWRALRRGCPEISLVRPLLHSYLTKPRPCRPGV